VAAPPRMSSYPYPTSYPDLVKSWETPCVLDAGGVAYSAGEAAGVKDAEDVEDEMERRAFLDAVPEAQGLDLTRLERGTEFTGPRLMVMSRKRCTNRHWLKYQWEEFEYWYRNACCVPDLEGNWLWTDLKNNATNWECCQDPETGLLYWEGDNGSLR
jgi:hypothetical protein